MAEQQRNWEERAKKLAGEATSQIVPKLEEEIRAKQERLKEVERELQEASLVRKLQEKSELEEEIGQLNGELKFARDTVVPKMVESAGSVGRNKDHPPRPKQRGGCFS